jgi:hypothetical protein
MQKSIITLVALALSAGSVGSVQAAVNIRQLDQERRIDAGHRSGNLTARETMRLKMEQRAIVAEEARMRARHGGELTRSDKRRLHARQKAAGHAITRDKYNSKRGPNEMKL